MQKTFKTLYTAPGVKFVEIKARQILCSSTERMTVDDETDMDE